MSLKNTPDASLLFNYSDIFFSFFFNDDTSCTHMARNHALTYIYSGEMLLQEKGRETVVRKGECAFIRRDHRVVIHKRPCGKEQYRGIFMMFTRKFLREVYEKMDKGSIPENVNPLERSVIKFPNTIEIESLFSSMVPYFNPAITPKDEFMELKMLEGIYALLNIDNRFFSTLFDFTEPWKIDIIDYLNENYMYDLPLEDIAHFTGRSLTTFKRDFKKVSDLTPQKWIIRKRLEVAYEKIRQEGEKVSEVYADVGFKNLSHFSTAFKKLYGFSPTNV